MFLFSIVLLLSLVKGENVGTWTPLPVARLALLGRAGPDRPQPVVAPSPVTSGCGERPAFEEKTQHSRIIMGSEAGVGEFPWQVSIQSENQHFCGGAILNAQWILTAAHCMYSEMLIVANLKVVVGTNDLTSPARLERSVTSIIYPKAFDKYNLDNDIALLLLSSPITFSDLIVPICLPTLTSPSKWHECWVAGWGQTKTDDKESMSMDLMKVPMVIMDREECVKVFLNLTKNMMCAGYSNKSYDACQGDSGGPLVCTQPPDKKWYQVGIISWGKGCGQKNTPGIYTVLINYDRWIENVTQLHGSPLYSKGPENTSKKKQADSRTSDSPMPEHSRSWFPLCPLFYMLRAIFY
ncbi:serine protease 55 isoform X1 [Ochotona curzoniae]|uniref:serine protease 55 isoform X1 n=1 Tax=Ochotona curzoniae TaxID=130825 RepID=UPI001B348347|nr:serine protease 55 isoform X1 [Ochotona curzoniae]